MTSLLLPRLGGAHTLGLSTAELEVAADGRVGARWSFASSEPLGGTPIQKEDLRALVLDGTEVTADGARCDRSDEGSWLTEGDGLVIQATYVCPADASEIGVTLYYLSALPPAHREIARIVGPPESHARAEAVLTGERRALSLALPDGEGSEHGRRVGRGGRRTTWGIAVAIVVAGVIASLVAWHRRRRRRNP